jgi:hypothetical protein
MVGRLVEPDAIRARSSTHAPGLLVGVELEISDEVARVVVEAGEVLRRWLLQGHYVESVKKSEMIRVLYPTLLRGPTQHRREG